MLTVLAETSAQWGSFFPLKPAFWRVTRPAKKDKATQEQDFTETLADGEQGPGRFIAGYKLAADAVVARKAIQLPPFSPTQRHSWAPPRISAHSTSQDWLVKAAHFPCQSSVNEEAGGDGGGQLQPTITMSGRFLTSPPGAEEGRKSLAPVLLMCYQEQNFNPFTLSPSRDLPPCLSPAYFAIHVVSTSLRRRTTCNVHLLEPMLSSTEHLLWFHIYIYISPHFGLV